VDDAKLTDQYHVHTPLIPSNRCFFWRITQ
jgi:hypothetical protein